MSKRSSSVKSRVGAPFVILVILVSVSLIACSSDNDGAGKAHEALPLVATSTGIWADVVSHVSCGHLLDVRAIVPRGADPHAFEASLTDRETMSQASLLVTNGLGLESGLADSFAAATQDGVAGFAMADHMDALPDGDPHVWNDPARVAGALGPLAEAIIENTGVDAPEVKRCTEEYRRKLMATDARVAATLDSVPPARRKLVTNHDSFEYLARRYGWEVIGSVIPSVSTLSETNPAELERLAKVIERERVPAIFAETQQSHKDIEALSSRLGGVEVVTLYTGSLGKPGSGADTYTGMLESNAELIAAALR